MLIRANRPNLKRYAKELLGPLWTEERERQLIRTVLNPPAGDYGHPSHRRDDHLKELDAILGTHGVEGIFEWKTGGSVDCLNYDNDDIIDVQYCNTGDTYDMTLLYWQGKLWIGDWGSIVEEVAS